jgi:hypothetical protein
MHWLNASDVVSLGHRSAELAVYDANVRLFLVSDLDSVQVPRHRRIPFKFALDGSL